MTLYPDAQRRAQEEIDRVIGSGGGARLPTLEDRGNLPYVNALIQEVLRWHPVAPLAVPHTTTEADEYDGYWIPKGAMIIANIW